VKPGTVTDLDPAAEFWNMNTHTLNETGPRLLRLQLRELDALRAVCRRQRWEMRLDQQRFRWFGPSASDRSLSPGWGRCAHVLVIPGCAFEIGLCVRESCFVPVWERSGDEALAAILGPGCRLLWQQYALEVLRRTLQPGHTLGAPLDLRGALRVRIADRASARCAHFHLGAAGTATFWLLGQPRDNFFLYLAEALGQFDDTLPANGEAS